jgi:hypothetical protein
VSRHCLAGVRDGSNDDQSCYAPLSSEETALILATMMTSSKPRTAPVEATIASVMAVDKSGLSRQADSAPAVTRDHKDRTLPNLRPTSIEATVARIMTVYERVQLFLLATAATTSLPVCGRGQSCQQKQASQNQPYLAIVFHCFHNNSSKANGLSDYAETSNKIHAVNSPQDY